jgi:hypothetical protein
MSEMGGKWAVGNGLVFLRSLPEPPGSSTAPGFGFWPSAFLFWHRPVSALFLAAVWDAEHRTPVAPDYRLCTLCCRPYRASYLPRGPIFRPSHVAAGPAEARRASGDRPACAGLPSVGRASVEAGDIPPPSPSPRTVPALVRVQYARPGGFYF